MGAFLLAPKKFTIAAESSGTLTPASNMNVDTPSLVWRSYGSSGAYVTVQTDGNAWDTIALIKSNLRSGDTIQIRAGNSASAVAGTTGLALNQTIAAYSGTDPADGLALSFLSLTSAITAPFVRLDFTSTGNPAGYVQAQRLVIGTRLIADGVDVGDEYGIEDSSGISDERGFAVVTPWPIRVSLKAGFSALSGSAYWTKWFPFFRSVGKSKGFLIVPNETSPHIQNEALFARLSQSFKAVGVASNYHDIDLSVLSIS